MKIILSIDGGGIRGIVPAAILNYLETRIRLIRKDDRIKIANLVDLVAGTSTGSIIGSLMIIPEEKKKRALYSMKDIMDMYVEMGPEVFKKNRWHSIKTLWGLIGPKYSASNIEDPLIQMLDHYKLKDLIQPCVFTGYDIDKRRVNIYTNKDKNEKYADYYVKDVVRGSISIPAFFRPAYFQEGPDLNTIIDGGVFANNPSMVAYIEASKTLFDHEDAKEMDPNDLLVISLGTGLGERTKYPYEKTKRWGAAQWFFPILNILLSASSDIVDYQMNKLFAAYGRPDNYKRINPPLEYSSNSATDGSRENITNLIKDANAYIDNNREFLNVLAREICDIKYLANYSDNE
jgi:patatin-like phospholipase/acyl hydrolase